MIVVPVLITNCHVSDYLKTGPKITHTIIISIALIKAAGGPAAFVMIPENMSNIFLTLLV